MNYDWTPISEPPEDDRKIVLYFDLVGWFWLQGHYDPLSELWHDDRGQIIYLPLTNLTHWKDVKPPTK